MRLALLEIKLGVFKMMRAFKFDMAADTPTPVRFSCTNFRGKLNYWVCSLTQLSAVDGSLEMAVSRKKFHTFEPISTVNTPI